MADTLVSTVLAPKTPILNFCFFFASGPTTLTKFSVYFCCRFFCKSKKKRNNFGQPQQFFGRNVTAKKEHDGQQQRRQKGINYEPVAGVAEESEHDLAQPPPVSPPPAPPPGLIETMPDTLARQRASQKPTKAVAKWPSVVGSRHLMSSRLGQHQHPDPHPSPISSGHQLPFK